jgi:hypothetical protein
MLKENRWNIFSLQPIDKGARRFASAAHASTISGAAFSRRHKKKEQPGGDWLLFGTSRISVGHLTEA